jgi:hypothetical protein
MSDVTDPPDPPDAVPYPDQGEPGNPNVPAEPDEPDSPDTPDTPAHRKHRRHRATGTHRNHRNHRNHRKHPTIPTSNLETGDPTLPSGPGPQQTEWEKPPASGGPPAVMAVGTTLSRVTGVIRIVVLAYALGTSTHLADAYNLANTLPNIIHDIVSRAASCRPRSSLSSSSA